MSLQASRREKKVDTKSSKFVSNLREFEGRANPEVVVSKNILNDNFDSPRKEGENDLKKLKTIEKFDQDERGLGYKMKVINEYREDIKDIRENKLKNVDRFLKSVDNNLERELSKSKFINSSKVYIDSRSKNALSLVTTDQILRGVTRNYEKFKNKYSKNINKLPDILRKNSRKYVKSSQDILLRGRNSHKKRAKATGRGASHFKRQKKSQNNAARGKDVSLDRRNTIEYMQQVKDYINYQDTKVDRDLDLDHKYMNQVKEHEEQEQPKEKTLKELLYPTIGKKIDSLSKKMYEVYTEKYEHKILNLSVNEIIRKELWAKIHDRYKINKDDHEELLKKKIEPSKDKKPKISFEKFRERIIPRESSKQIKKIIEIERKRVKKDLISRKPFSNGYYQILALGRQSRNRVKKKLSGSNNKFSRFQVVFD